MCFEQELTTIFSATCPTIANATAAGPLLYQSVLQSVYGNTTPVDFVELPSTRDVVYVTPTSVGLISTKRIHFLDRTQPGYVRATNLLFCPPAQFGTVGGVCKPCGDRTAVGYYVSAAWQIQCPASAAAGGVSPPYETFTVLNTPDVTGDMLTSGLCAFTESRNVSCPSEITALPGQVLNVAADLLGVASDSQLLQASASSSSVILCLIEAAEAATGASLLRVNPAEFMTRVVAAGTQLTHATAQRNSVGAAAAINFSNPVQAVPMATWCSTRLAYGPGAYLQCAVKYYTTNQAAGAGSRRLLQQQQQTASSGTTALPHHDPVFASSTYVNYDRVLPSDRSLSPSGNQSAPAPAGTSAAFPMALAIGLSVGCAVVAVGVAAIFLTHQRASARTLGRFVRPSWGPPQPSR